MELAPDCNSPRPRAVDAMKLAPDHWREPIVGMSLEDEDDTSESSPAHHHVRLPLLDEGLSLESDGDIDGAEREPHGHEPHGYVPHGQEPSDASEKIVPSLLVYPITVKRPIASDLAFSFSWPERLLISLKRLFGEETVSACLCGPARSVSNHFSGFGDI